MEATPSKPDREPEDELEQDLIVVAGLETQPASTKEDKCAVVARQILSENPNIAQQMMEQLRAHPKKPLQLEEFQTVTKLVEDQPQEEVAQEGTTFQEAASKKLQVD